MYLKRIMPLLILSGLWSCNSKPETTTQEGVAIEITGRTTSLTREEIKDLDSLNIDFQFRGNCYAHSSDEYTEESNGEASSGNFPKKVDNSFPKNELYLVISPNEFSKIRKTSLGCKLLLVNTTNKPVKLEASDSRLYIVAEALNDKKEWVPVSYLPVSHCGNSYHTVVLDTSEYWSFDIPVFKGTIKTKIRYTLSMENDRTIHSNEIVAYLNKEQFDPDRKEGYTGDNIMDPYDD